MSGTPLTDAINALTTYSNTVTGASDTTLSDAVATLASGYGGGGSDNLPALAMGTVVDSEVDWSSITKLRTNAFYDCTALQTVGNPTIPQLPSGGFRGCTALKNVEITASNVTQTYCGNIFRGCTNLETATIHFTYTGNNDVDFGETYAFSGDSKLHTVILERNHATKSIGLRANWMFENCTLLRNLVLKTSVMVTLTNGVNANAWGGLWNNPTDSKIWVPSALISSYQTTGNWATLYSHGISFVAIEGSIYE